MSEPEERKSGFKQLPNAEQEICLRFGHARRSINSTQAEIASVLKISRNQIANIEAKRVPLKFWLGERFCSQLGISQSWLATGAPPQRSHMHPDVRGYDPRPREDALFSDVYHRFIAGELSKLWEQSAELEKLRANPPPRLRSEMLDYCGKLDARAKAMRKDLESHQAYCAKIEAFASRIRMDFGHGSRQTYEANIHALAAAMRRDLKLPNPEENKVLTEVTPERNLAGMTEIAFLLQRLKRALEGVRKGDLARSLKVPLPRVSEWLSGRVMPSGETALRLLQWVEQRERKPNAPDSATNAVKGKATRRKVVYEKKPTSSHKQE